MSDLRSLAQMASTNARRVEQELDQGDLVMAEGHAILLAQQAEELLAAVTAARDTERAAEWASTNPGQEPQ